ncbi:MAG: lytic murein transglycosylase [Actinobacteria bacterium]|nr:lytic murein transglycosylase [Actinomycetota bacterium]
MVLQAYHSAANRLGQDEASCKLPWWLLAGIGHTESGHAESGRLTADGTTRGRILGPRLDGGIAGDAVITDTDHGALDGDKVYDRAVGPMQFIPSTWRTWGVDGNGDGKADPNNIFDATLAAGRYLCADGRDLSTDAGRKAAVLSYNYSPAYLATVLAWGTAYRDGASSVPDSPLPVVSDVTKVRPPRSARPPKHVAKPSTSPSAPVSSSQPAPSGSSSASGSASGSSSTSATASANPTCTSTSPGTSPDASPTPTDSASSSVAVQSASGQSHAAPSGSATGSATADGSATSAAADGSATSRPQTATAQGSTGSQSNSGQSNPEESSSASSSTSAPASCAP